MHACKRKIAWMIGRSKPMYEEFMWYHLEPTYKLADGRQYTDVLIRQGNQDGSTNRSGVVEAYEFLPVHMSNPTRVNVLPGQISELWSHSPNLRAFWADHGYKTDRLPLVVNPQVPLVGMARHVGKIRFRSDTDLYHFYLDTPWNSNHLIRHARYYDGIDHVLVAVHAPYMWADGRCLGGAYVFASNHSGERVGSLEYHADFPGCTSYLEALSRIGYQLVPRPGRIAEFVYAKLDQL